jgi:hypothetical protein
MVVSACVVHRMPVFFLWFHNDYEAVGDDARMTELLRSSLVCAECGKQLKKADEDQLGDPIDWDIAYEQYLCEGCYDKIWDDLFRDKCPVCENHPCEKPTGECWVNPWPRIMYMCLVLPLADKKEKNQRVLEVEKL